MKIWDIIDKKDYKKWSATAKEPCIKNYLRSTHYKKQQIPQKEEKTKLIIIKTIRDSDSALKRWKKQQIKKTTGA